jgi:hypothetical protein
VVLQLAKGLARALVRKRKRLQSCSQDDALANEFPVQL